jgi:tripartite-type tricarboxylate transporter receptor subunit TctC
MRSFQSVYPFVVCALLLLGRLGWAQSDKGAFPQKPVHLILTFGPAGSTATLSGMMQAKFAALLGQEVVLDYVGGGSGGSNGVRAAKAAAPDGYSMVMGTVGNISLLPSTYLAYGVDPLRDLVPITNIADTPDVLVVQTSVPANTFAEFVALAKNQPGGLTYAVMSATSIHNVEVEAIMREAGIQLKAVPVSGGAGGQTGPIAEGKVNLLITTAPYVLREIRAGKVKALAIAHDERSPAFPGVPTMNELRIPSLPIGSWMGLFAPAGTPRPLVEKLFAAAKQAAEDPDVKRAAAAEGMFVHISSSPEEFKRFVEKDTERLSSAVKRLGIKPE